MQSTCARRFVIYHFFALYFPCEQNSRKVLAYRAIIAMPRLLLELFNPCNICDILPIHVAILFYSIGGFNLQYEREEKTSNVNVEPFLDASNKILHNFPNVMYIKKANSIDTFSSAHCKMNISYYFSAFLSPSVSLPRRCIFSSILTH